MEQPLFSVVLFTKNRPQLAACALQSVLRQTCGDFELIISDNDDTEDTATVLRAYDDPRIRYFRTDGTLSMPDNWEYGLSLARGRYVTSMTDRIALKSYALAAVKQEIERTGEDVYVWGFDMLDAEGAVFGSMRPSVGSRTRVVPSATLLNYFLHQTFGGYTNYLPKSLNSCCTNTVLEEIRRSPVGRVCPPVNPDHTMAFLTLTHRPRVVLMNKSLYAWHSFSASNGASLIYGGETATRFLRDLGMTEADLSREVPIKTVEIHNSICNDLLRLKRMDPERFRGIELDMFYYFVVCRLEIEDHFRPDHPLFATKMAAWDDALAKQPPEVIAKVEQYLRRRYTLFKPLFQSRAVWLAKQSAKGLLRTMRSRPAPGTEGATPTSEVAPIQGRGPTGNVLEALASLESRERAMRKSRASALGRRGIG